MTTRRDFLKQVATASLAGAAVSQSDQQVFAEKKQDDFLEIIDCHTHFYDPKREEGVPWPPKKSPLYRTVLPKHLRALPKPKPVTGTVIVEASKWVEDNQWLLDLAKDDPFIVGIVGNLQLDSETYTQDLKRFSANPLFRGIRVLHLPAEKQLAVKNYKPFQQLASYDLGLDLNGSKGMLATAEKIAKAVPDLRIVINHIGNIPLDHNGPQQDWITGMRKAAKQKNVFCKVSALVEGAHRAKIKAPTDIEFYKPYLDVLWDEFGDDRLIFGSNWPVSDRAADYATLQKIMLDYLATRGACATRKYFSENAKQVYKWVERKGRLPQNS